MNLSDAYFSHSKEHTGFWNPVNRVSIKPSTYALDQLSRGNIGFVVMRTRMANLMGSGFSCLDRWASRSAAAVEPWENPAKLPCLLWSVFQA